VVCPFVALVAKSFDKIRGEMAEVRSFRTSIHSPLVLDTPDALIRVDGRLDSKKFITFMIVNVDLLSNNFEAVESWARSIVEGMTADDIQYWFDPNPLNASLKPVDIDITKLRRFDVSDLTK
jgi:hypothetical protein